MRVYFAFSLYNLIVHIKEVKLAKSKLNKSLLRQAKKAVKEAGNELPSNRQEMREAAREVKRAVRENKEEKPSVKWNLGVGDLVEIAKGAHYAPDNVKLGCIVAINSSHARNIKDWSQTVTILTKVGSIKIHPRFAKVIQKA